MIWMEADVGDQFRFPARPIPAGQNRVRLGRGAADLANVAGEGGFDGFLRRTDTHAFLVAWDDRLVYERYFGGSQRPTLQTSLLSRSRSFPPWRGSRSTRVRSAASTTR